MGDSMATDKNKEADAYGFPPEAYDPSALPDFETDFVPAEHLEAFAQALSNHDDASARRLSAASLPTGVERLWLPRHRSSRNSRRQKQKQQQQQQQRQRQGRRTRDETREGYLYW